MRYLVQLVIPALIFVAVVYLLTRRRHDANARAEPRERSDVLPLLGILTLGAIVAVASAVALQAIAD